MRPVLSYGKLTEEELREELVLLTSALSAAYDDLANTLHDQQHDFLQAYIQSPGQSIAAKNREAQYATLELSQQIIVARAKINRHVLARDLVVLLLVGSKAGDTPFPTLADFDEQGLVTA